MKTVFKQDDLELRAASLTLRRELASVLIDRGIVERDYQIDCIDTPCREITTDRRKLLVEMTSGAGCSNTSMASSSA
ncbi:hypothetical protein LP416_02290 [Polaromonas sp. P2-4]|nr:hypothetical protein LP416_02290 [Polaromonas sp. P2-4]